MESSRQHKPEQTTEPSVPQQRAAPPVAPPKSGRGWSRFRVFLAVTAGSLALLCLGGLGLGYVLYDQATEPDRTAPDVAVSSFLRALLIDRNEATVAAYSCGDRSALDPIMSFSDETEAREREHGISIRVSWGSLTVRLNGARAAVTTDIIRTISDGSERDVHRWEFDVVNDAGWRVCGARRI